MMVDALCLWHNETEFSYGDPNGMPIISAGYILLCKGEPYLKWSRQLVNGSK